MRQTWLATFLLILSSTFSLNANAIEKEDMYIGVKTGRYLMNIDKANDATALGIQIGYEFLPGLAFEFEMMDGETHIDSEDVELDTIGFYGTYRTDGDIYFMLKLGRVDQERDTEGEITTDGTVSWGTGAGMEFGRFSIELDMTTIDSSISYVGLNSRILFKSLYLW